MGILTMLARFYAARVFKRSGVCLSCAIAISSLLTVPASVWATTREAGNAQINSIPAQRDFAELVRAIDPLHFIPDSPSLLPKNEAIEVRRAIESYPDVVVFPIRVAGPSVAISASFTRKLANQVADASGNASIAILYPDIGEPYRSVFTQIIGGIEERAKVRVANFAVGQNMDVEALKHSLRSQDTKVVIALGRQGVKAAASLDEHIEVVVGGVLTASDDESRNMQVNSLSPDPALLFSRLKGMMPKVRRIFTVYDPRHNTWMIDLAKMAARVQGLELVAYEAKDLRSAMHAYQEILATTDSNQDALWLLQDPTTVDEGSVLPLVLQESWAHNLAVFSSSFGHVRRGVLFSLYPNNVELGRHLAHSALGLLASSSGEVFGMFPLREVLMAVNLRTAKHLGIDVRRQQGFDMAFPEQ